jgi:hypothetical protein
MTNKHTWCVYTVVVLHLNLVLKKDTNCLSLALVTQ